jgi:ElaB/YqjD/DUF883 family membrane-anchored ribosome-binding protein
MRILPLITKTVIAKGKLSLLSCFLLIGCLPRGETKSLDEILSASRTRFYRSAESSIKENVSATLKTLAASLDSVIKNEPAGSTSSDLKAVKEDIAKRLEELTSRAGYTSRPALNEITKQWYAAANAVGDTTRLKAIDKLLVTRTFNLLASELRGVKFAVGERDRA